MLVYVVCDMLMSVVVCCSIATIELTLRNSSSAECRCDTRRDVHNFSKASSLLISQCKTTIELTLRNFTSAEWRCDT